MNLSRSQATGPVLVSNEPSLGEPAWTATPPTVGQNLRSRLRRLLEVSAGGGSVRPGWGPVPIAAAMVGVAFWWVETPTVWPWPYLPVLLVVGAVLAGCWWVVARRDGLQLARLTAPDMGAVLLWFGVAGVASSVLAVVFDSGLPSPFTPADSPGFAVVQTVVVSVATAVVEEATAAAVVLAAAALMALRRPWTGWAPWVAIGVGAASRVALHVPLWGSEAVIRCGFALIMAWLFWRLRLPERFSPPPATAWSAGAPSLPTDRPPCPGTAPTPARSPTRTTRADPAAQAEVSSG